MTNTINQDFPVYDKVAPSWADFKAKFKGYSSSLLEMKDVAAFETNATLEVGEQRGASGGKVMRSTTGASKNEGKMTLYSAGLHDLLDNLSAGMQRRGDLYVYGTVFFDAQLFWTPFGSDEIFERQVNGIRILGSALAAAEGTDAQKVEIPLYVSEIIDVIRGKKYVIL